MFPFHDFSKVRCRVMRRCVYALNTLAMRDDRLPRDGAFDAAAANGLAAIVALQDEGLEYEANEDRVKSPMALLKIVRNDSDLRTNALQSPDLRTLKKGIKKAQEFRHGRAEEDWDVLRDEHIDALIALDQHPALEVLELVDGMNFEEAAVTVFEQEALSLLPSDPEERSFVPDPAYCDNCGRMTLLAEDWDMFGFGVGEGGCISCGLERTYDDTVNEFIAWKLEESD